MTCATLPLLDWAAGTTVTDVHGAPLRVYHGTLAAIALTDLSVRGTDAEPSLGAYFTARPEVANRFIGRTGGQIFPVYLRLVRPFDLRGLSVDAVAEAIAQIDPSAAEALRAQIVGGLYAPYQALEFVDQRFGFGARLRTLNYDGIIFEDALEGTTYVIFEGEQIRSAFA